MAVTRATFIVRFPEFTSVSEAMWSAHHAAALQETPSETWGDWQDEGVMQLTAHKLAITPYGLNAKLSSKEGESVYGRERKRLDMIVAFGIGRVSGQSAEDLANLG